MILTWSYNNTTYAPEAPVVSVYLWSDPQQSVEVDALIDSGSDNTAVPLHYLQQINARKVEQARMVDISGKGHIVNLYDIQLRLGEISMYMTVIGDSVNKDVILGRDILNHLTITLDGPAGTTIIPVDSK